MSLVWDGEDHAAPQFGGSVFVKMKILIFIFVCLIVVLYLFLPSKKVKVIPKIQGNLKDIENYINRLMVSDNDNSFLIIGISGTEDFIQFSGDNKGVQLDFPLVTDRQKELESHFRQSAKKEGLKIIDNTGSDGSFFLDIDINGSSAEITKVISALLKRVFGVTESSTLEIQLGV